MENNSEIPISAEEFSQLKDARRILFKALSIEETYDILIDNYSEFENELMQIALNSMLYGPYDYSDFYKIRSRLNKRLINFLTTARLYVDYIKQRVGDMIPLQGMGVEKVNEFLSEKYDNNLEYRFMEELRNFVQHCELPIHLTSLHSGMNDYKDISKGIVHSVDIFSGKNYLNSENNFKNKILSEIGEKIELKLFVRKYIECFSDIHCSIRKIVANEISDARKSIEFHIIRCKKGIQKKILGLMVINSDENGNIIEEFPLLLEWDDIRISLEKKNRHLKNLSVRYISGELKNE